jgi:hypothetical protein
VFATLADDDGNGEGGDDDDGNGESGDDDDDDDDGDYFGLVTPPRALSKLCKKQRHR